jgi:hypothetical protein
MDGWLDSKLSYALKFSRAISHINVEFKANVSEISIFMVDVKRLYVSSVEISAYNANGM